MKKNKLKQEVEKLSKLEKNWDSYGAEPIGKNVINRVNNIIDILDDKYLDPFIVPSSLGIQLEWHNIDKELEVYIDEEFKNIQYLKVVGENELDWEEDEFSDIKEINKLLEWLYGERNEKNMFKKR